jgi:pimeloyl-ACP methyl ester carboxylesterase
VDLHVVEQGEGPPLLLIHGFGTNAFTWAKIRVMLSLRNTVLAIDLKGFGDSPKPRDRAYSLGDHAEAVLQLVERRKLDDLAIVGHSWGGAVALLVALELEQRAAARVRSLVLIDSMCGPQHLPRFLALLRGPVLGALIVGLVPPIWLARFVLLFSYFDPRKIEDAFVDAYAAQLRERAGRRALRATARGMISADFASLLRRCGDIRAPVLLLWGSEDRIVPLSVGERLAATIPGARLVVLERCGHVPQEEAAEATLGVLREVL